MMLGVFFVVWLCLLNTAAGQNTAPYSTTPSSASKQRQQELHGIKQLLASLQKSMQQMLNLQQGKKQVMIPKQKAVPASYSFASYGTSMEFLAMKNKLLALETKLEVTETKQKAKEAKEAAKEALFKTTRSNRNGGSTFVRWGRKTCTNRSQEVYCGVAGGSYYGYYGGAANRLCLTLTPQHDNMPRPGAYGVLYGGEYEHVPGHHDHDVPCCVCHVPRAATIMMPATHACPKGWTTQYTGRLASTHVSFKAASQFVCLDKDLENASSGHLNQNGNMFSYTITVCGSLPCPPYANNKVVLCVVCSK
ncbi:hypothetical protein ACOMHN_022587 [Nucella lapillus]